MTENMIWLIELLSSHSIGSLASLIENGKLKAYDRFDRFGDAKEEQKSQALDALAEHVRQTKESGNKDYLRRLEVIRRFPNHILTTSGFLRADLDWADQSAGRSIAHPLRDEVLTLSHKAKWMRLLELFRSFGGRRPIEDRPGKRGALMKLSRATGIDDKNLALGLDKEIAREQRRRLTWPGTE